MNGRVGSVWRRLRGKRPRDLLQRAITKAADRFGTSELDFPLLEQDCWDSGRPLVPARASGTAHPSIGWVVVPPGIGSGGHTTLFTMVQAASEAGFDNTLLFYDRYGGDFRTNVARLRAGWPWLDCDVVPAPARFDGFDAYVASSWATAHVVASRTHLAPVPRLYFVQDYEPYFYPRGSLYAMAEDTYRFGLTNVALGEMVKSAIETEAGAGSRVVPFGVDREHYRLDPGQRPRSGVVFFAKINSDRRGYRIARLALREFQRRRPDVPIHVYGDTVRDDGLRVTNHGYLAPDELNRLYNGAAAGLVLSFTNVSLIPGELAAAGVLPVMNDYPGARLVFDHPTALWAAPTPSALAGALESAVDAARDGRLAPEIAGSSGPDWGRVGQEFAALLSAATR